MVTKMSIQEFENENIPLAIAVVFLAALFVFAMLRCPKEPILPITIKDSCMTQTHNTLFHRHTKLDIMV
jgi:hypothetical protein